MDRLTSCSEHLYLYEKFLGKGCFGSVRVDLFVLVAAPESPSLNFSSGMQAACDEQVHPSPPLAVFGSFSAGIFLDFEVCALRVAVCRVAQAFLWNLATVRMRILGCAFCLAC